MAQQESQGQGNSAVGGELVLWLLSLIGISGAVFTRRRFGFRAVMPLKFPVIAFILMVFHDLAADTSGQPELLQGTSLTLRFCEILIPLGIWRYIEAWLAYRRKEIRHTYFWGEPWITSLGVPFKLAVFLDPVLVSGVGYLLHPYDHLLGSWLMWSGFCLFITMGMSLKGQAEDAEALHNARIYTSHMHERSDPRPRQGGAPVPEDNEEVSTGPRAPQGSQRRR